VPELGRVRGTDQFSDVDRHPGNERTAGVVVLRVEGGLFFANADAVRDRIRTAASAETRAVVIDAEAMPFIDVTGVRMLNDLASTLAPDVQLVVAHDVGQVRDLLAAAAEGRGLTVHATVEEALRALSASGPA
jgi:anti-anti-sigma factor